MESNAASDRPELSSSLDREGILDGRPGTQQEWTTDDMAVLFLLLLWLPDGDRRPQERKRYI